MVQQIKMIATQPDDLSLHSRTEVKSQIQAYIYNPSTPTVRWETEKGYQLEACAPTSLEHTGQKQGRRKTQLLEAVLTPHV